MKKMVTVIMVLVLALGMVSEAVGADSPTVGPTTNGNTVVTKVVVTDISTTNTKFTAKIYKIKQTTPTIALGPYRDEEGKELWTLVKNGALKYAANLKTLKVKGKMAIFGRGAFALCSKLTKLDLRNCKFISFSSDAFAGMSKAKLKKLKIVLPKNMSNTKYKKIKKQLKKIGIKGSNISRG